MSCIEKQLKNWKGTIKIGFPYQTLNCFLTVIMKKVISKAIR
jgi:hypothetical protein